jgi:hypothetical protein
MTNRKLRFVGDFAIYAVSAIFGGLTAIFAALGFAMFLFNMGIIPK